MSESSDFLVQRVIQIQVPPEQEQAARAVDVAALPPGPEQLHARDAMFAAPDRPATAEEQQAAAAMALLYAQQLLLGCAATERRMPEPPPRPQLDDDNDPEDA
jgi:hypothetical protein